MSVRMAVKGVHMHKYSHVWSSETCVQRNFTSERECFSSIKTYVDIVYSFLLVMFADSSGQLSSHSLLRFLTEEVILIRAWEHPVYTALNKMSCN